MSRTSRTIEVTMVVTIPGHYQASAEDVGRTITQMTTAAMWREYPDDMSTLGTTYVAAIERVQPRGDTVSPQVREFESRLRSSGEDSNA